MAKTTKTNTKVATNNKSSKATALSRRPRQWIYDRVNGINRNNEQERPPCFLCYAPMILKLCPWLWEENIACQFMGRYGLCKPDNVWARSAVLKYGMILNIFGILTLIYSTFGMTRNMQLLQVSSWSKGTVQPTPKDFFKEPVTIDVGIRAFIINNPNTVDNGNSSKQLFRFDELCNFQDTLGDSSGLDYYMNPLDCDICNTVSIQIIACLMVAVIANVATLSTDMLRMYDRFDVNCQRFWVTLLSLCTLVGCGLSFYHFQYTCLKTFHHDTPLSYNRLGESVKAGARDEVVRMNYQWNVGYGMICLFAGFGLKVLHIICHCCCIPTPSITRQLEEQEEYEQLYGTKSSDSDKKKQDGDDGDHTDEEAAAGGGIKRPSSAKNKYESSSSSSSSFG